MTTLMSAHNQWLTRPADERFLSLTALAEFCTAQRRASAAKIVSSRALTAVPVSNDASHEGLQLTGPNGQPVDMTHWSFGQLAQRAGAPSGYLRDLPAPLAADCLNYGLKHNREVEEIGVLLTRMDQTKPAVARAVTGPNYGRVWNSNLANALVHSFGDGVTGRYKVPGEFGVQGQAITAQNTTLYASDRDMWVFLADESRSIEIKNRRNGRTGRMSHGFFAWNSDVGKSTLGFAEFLFDYMCGNHIVWGVSDYREIKLRHTSGAPDRYAEKIEPMLQDIAAASADLTPAARSIEAAQRRRIENVEKFLTERFSRSEASLIAAAHLADEERPIETAWDAVTGITAYARGIAHTDTRVALEREAGKILTLVAA
jgi:hypothetical protein